MKPANFPARKDARRRRTLDRLLAMASPSSAQKADIATLRSRLNAAASSVRTKKNRTNFARFAR